MKAIKKSFPYGRHTVTLETGEIARQADGAVLVSMDDTVVLVTCVARTEVKQGQDFFPLTVDYQEKTFAAGKIPGGFFKREGRPSEKEILTCRLIDRPLRPLFPDGFYNEIQVIVHVLSLNPEVSADIVRAMRNLKADGRACIQSITIRDDLFDRYAAGTDFIQKHIFPGGMLPSDHQLTQHAEAAGLRVLERKAFGADYARTLRLWRASFEQQLDAIRDLGYDERFVRMWRFYLAYCEAGFEEGTIDVCQFTLAHAT